MSRVFEALKRASEKHKKTFETSEDSRSAAAPQIPNPIIEQSEALLPPSREAIASQRTSSPNGDSAPPLLLYPGENVRTKTWRERLEGILIGRGTRRFKSHPIIALETDSPVAEQYKILREQIKKLRTDIGARCLSVTSPIRGDGKTMVAVNLAAAMALDYEGKVLLIDGDLRRPEVHRYFGIHSSPGLGDYLISSGNGNLMSYVKDTFIPGFQIFPGGKSSHLSSELLGKEKMKILMEEIRATFPEHQIILDAPPVLTTPDPLVLGRHVDGVIVVVRAGKTPRDYLVKAIQSLNSTKVLGIVLNDVQDRTSAKQYSYSEANA